MSGMSTTCAHCERFSNMTAWGKPRWSEPPSQLGGRDNDWKMFDAAYSCDHCGRLSIAFGVTPKMYGGAFSDDPSNAARTFWIPTKGYGKEFPDVPDAIASVATEAHACRSTNALRAAVGLARAVIEATAKAKGIEQGNLVKKIDELHAQGHIRDYIKDAAHEVRHNGNSILHGDLVDDPVDAETAEEVLALMDRVLDEVFQGPAQVAKAKERRLAREQQQAVGGQT